MKVATRTDDNTMPRFKWVFYQLDGRWELREVGETGAYATVFTHSSDIHRRSRKAGFRYALYVRGINGPVASCRESDDAKKLGEKLAAEAMATQNTIAWAASRPAREAARRAEAEARAAKDAADATERFRRNQLLAEALDQYIANTEDVLEDGDTEELTRMGITTEKLNRARAMLDEFNGHIQKTLAG